MAQKTKQCYLLTFQGKSQPQDGNGSSSMDSHTPTGNHTPVILRSISDLSSPLEIPSGSQSGAVSNSAIEKNASGECGVMDTDMLKFWEELADRHVY